MALRDKLTRRVPIAWAVASVAAVVIVVGGIAAINFQRAQAKEVVPTADAGDTPGTLEQLEAILRDPDKEAQARIDQALKLLDDLPKRQPRPRALSPGDPFADIGSPFASPLDPDEWDPWSEMSRFRQNMDRLFNDALSRMRLGARSSLPSELPAWSPQGEFEENEDAYIYRFDLPGVDKSEVEIAVEEGRLIIEGRRESSIEESNEDQGLFRREIRHGQFQRVIALPGDVDPGGAIESQLKNGVLTIRLPKLQEARKSERRKIEIQ